MPVVKREKLTFEGQTFVHEISCGSTGWFTSNLPPAVAELREKPTVTAKTLDECNTLYREAMEDYRQRKTVKRRVIVYQLSHDTYVTEDNTWYGQVVFRSTRSYFSSVGEKGVSLAVAAQVFDEYKTSTGEEGSGKFKRERFAYRFEAVPSSIPIGMRYTNEETIKDYPRGAHTHVVDWTEQRETFFAQLGSNLNTLIIKIAQFMEDNTKMLKLVDKGHTPKMLAAPTPQPDRQGQTPKGRRKDR